MTKKSEVKVAEIEFQVLLTLFLQHHTALYDTVPLKPLDLRGESPLYMELASALESAREKLIDLTDSLESEGFHRDDR